MAFRHVVHHCAILTRASCQPDVGSDTVAIAEDLHGPLGQPYLHFLLEVLAGNAVEHLFHGDMVVVLYRGSFPQGKLIGGIRQRKQVYFFFFLKTAFAASWFLLEWPAVEFLQFLPDCLIQIAQGEKCGVSQGSGNPSGYKANRPLGRGFVLLIGNYR